MNITVAPPQKSVSSEHKALIAIGYGKSRDTYRRLVGGKVGSRMYKEMYDELWRVANAGLVPAAPVKKIYGVKKQIGIATPVKSMDTVYVELTVWYEEHAFIGTETYINMDRKIVKGTMRRDRAEGWIHKQIAEMRRKAIEEYHFLQFVPELWLEAHRRQYPNPTMVRIMKMHGTTKQDLINRVYGDLRLAYLENERWEGQHSCTIETLVSCGYSEIDIERHFGNEYSVKDMQFKISDIIEFIEGFGGSYYVYDLYDSCVVRSEGTGNHNYRAFMCLLGNGHCHEVISDDVRRKLLAIAKDKRVNGHKSDKKKVERVIDKRIEYKRSDDLQKIMYDYIRLERKLPRYKIIDGKYNEVEFEDVLYTANKDFMIGSAILGVASVKSLPSIMCDKFNEVFGNSGMSFPNVEVRALLEKSHVNIGGKQYRFKAGEVIDGIDCNKMYANECGRIAMNYIDPTCEVTRWDGESEDGLYFVESNDFYLFRGNGIYSACVIRKALEVGIEFTVKYWIPVKRAREAGFMKGFISDLFIKYGKRAKMLFNPLTGCFNKDSKKDVRKTTVVLDEVDAAYYVNAYGAEITTSGGTIWSYDEIEGLVEGVSEGEPIYACNLIEYKGFICNRRVLYIDILSNSYVTMYNKMAEIGLDHVVCIKTDFIGLDCEYTGEVGTAMGMFKHESIKNDILNYPEQMYTIRDCKFTENIWTDFDVSGFDDDNNWERLSAVLRENLKRWGAMFIEGSAGTGKSSLAKRISDNCLKLAPTNAAALRIDGRTLHSFFNETWDNLVPKLVSEVNKHEVVVFDECSMYDSKLWQIINLVKERCSAGILIVGDFEQLEPIGDTTNYVDSLMLKRICSMNRVRLTKNRRFNFNWEELVWTTNCRPAELPVPRGICYFNSTRISNTTEIINDVYFGNKYMVGYPMVCNENIKSKGLLNNSRYEIVGIEGEIGGYIEEVRNPRDMTNAGEEDVERWNMYKEIVAADILAHKDTRIHLRNLSTDKVVAYSYSDLALRFTYGFVITVYCAQGLDFDFDYCVLDYKYMNRRMRYVSLTRATDLSHLVNFN